MTIKDRGPISRKLRNVQNSARKRGLVCTLTWYDVAELLLTQRACRDCYCEFADGEQHPRRRSFDRISSDYGYTRENVQLLCQTCNSDKDNKPGMTEASLNRGRRRRALGKTSTSFTAQQGQA